MPDKANKALGTLWIAHHDAASRFCSDDARILEQLAVQLVLALKLLEHPRNDRSALALVESYQLAHRKAPCPRSRGGTATARASGGFRSQIRQALLFKETAIHEVNHRAKNTLQIAAGLLSLHSRATASTEVRSALEECQGRLHLLANVHEMLCADSTQKISMPTLLQAVADALRQSFAEMSGRVTLRVTCDKMVLAADDAIPLALLANEIMTNAYKHAFPEQRSGVIAVNLMSAAGNSIVLRIMDNGIGIRSEGADSSLGLKLVRSFAQQLRGAVAFEKPPSASGTVVRLSMQCPNPRAIDGPG